MHDIARLPIIVRSHKPSKTVRHTAARPTKRQPVMAMPPLAYLMSFQLGLLVYSLIAFAPWSAWEDQADSDSTTAATLVHRTGSRSSGRISGYRFQRCRNKSVRSPTTACWRNGWDLKRLRCRSSFATDREDRIGRLLSRCLRAPSWPPPCPSRRNDDHNNACSRYRYLKRTRYSGFIDYQHRQHRKNIATSS